jgi:hypothetical protein
MHFMTINGKLVPVKNEEDVERNRQQWLRSVLQQPSKKKKKPLR